MSIEPPRTNPGVYHEVEDLLALMSFYEGLPTEALIATLKDRGVAEGVNFEDLEHSHLVSLAVHTHTARWQSLLGAHRPPPQKEEKRRHSIMLDLPL